METFSVTYALHVPTYEEAKQVAWSIQVEQTIEFPYELLGESDPRRHMVGQLLSLEEKEDCFLAKIAYPVETSGLEVTQFLNVVFGNSSLQPHIWVVDIEFSPSLLDVFTGPKFGLAGIRELCQTPTRPMIQAVIKPMGTPNEELARMCHAYTMGGADVIKDDHGLTNQSFSPFKDRVSRCAHAVQEANAKSGHHTLYAANVSGDGTDVLERAHYAKEAGATALMVAPSLIGFGWLHRLATDDSLNLPLIVHPAMMGGFTLPGTSGIAATIWMGLLPRIFGGDMNIFVSYGGRFTFKPDLCRQICDSNRGPLASIKSSCPSPGGGVTEARLPELVNIYGKDTMFLVGGDMFRRGPDLTENMKAFIDVLERS